MACRNELSTSAQDAIVNAAKAIKVGIERRNCLCGQNEKREVWEPIEMREKDRAGA
jgi:hypothetical protein